MKLCVLLGGTSSERDVSLVSGFGMAKALEKNGHDVTLLDPATGRAMRIDEFQSNPPNTAPPTLDALGDLSQGSVLLDSLMSPAVRDAEVVVFGLHGVPGEDGPLQSVLELLGKKYTGSSAKVSTVCIDKALTKIIMEESEIATPKWTVVPAGLPEELMRELFPMLCDELKLPMVIKPNDQGSTVGLTILKEKDADAFVAGVQSALLYSDKALIEEFIEGRELTVTILDDEPLPIVEIAPEGGFYDYHHKYTKGMTVYTCPADLPDEVTEGIQQDALAVFIQTGATGYARIDFRLRPDNSWSCLEINTLPGMTETSLTPKAAKAAGITFEELCERILMSAFSK
ncbi:MAG: D-alanine--D-alanine ligase [Candidatus Kapaibacterium sp.]|jgi:D-alanine-D-alanine ligase